MSARKVRRVTFTQDGGEVVVDSTWGHDTLSYFIRTGMSGRDKTISLTSASGALFLIPRDTIRHVKIEEVEL